MQKLHQHRNQQPLLAKKLSGPSLKAFRAICDRWQLSIDEASDLMGNPPRGLFAQWFTNQENVLLDELQIKRISYLLAIYNSLKVYLPDQESSLAWVRCPNDDGFFAGKSPLEQMRKGRLGYLKEVLLHIT